VACVAAGVHDLTRRMVAAMSISVPTVRWSDDIAAALATMVTEGARRLSDQLGAT
jgi:DNA-binding IclR family transcriptional regulator